MTMGIGVKMPRRVKMKKKLTYKIMKMTKGR
jgi:hypothetical protein